MNAEIQSALDRANTEADRANSLAATNQTLLEGLSAIIAAGGSATDVVAAIDALTAKVKAANDTTAAADTANTPA